MKDILGYLTTLVTFLIIDFTWLGIIAKKLYRDELGSLLKTQFNLPVAFVFYVIFTLGLYILVILPAVEKQSISKLIVTSILFGVVTYATYDLTNLATLNNWSTKITMIDIVWGGVLSLVTSFVGYQVLIRI